MKSSALQAVAASAVLCGGVSGAAEIRYALDEPAFVTIAVEDASGRRVRNLVSAQRREAGECGETLDGFDDAGNPCAAGVYRWRVMDCGGFGFQNGWQKAADASADSARPVPVPGDIRILFAPDGANGAVAVRYAFSDPSVPDKARHAFSSPVGTAWVDRIDHPQIEAAITRTDDGYDFSADIPWEALGEKAMPTHGETRRADVGVIFGDADGGRTVRRAYLFDQEAQIVDDLPGEVRVRPANWGELHF